MPIQKVRKCRRTKIVSLRGSLETVSLREILRLLSQAGETGTLDVSGPGAHATICFDAGQVAKATNGSSEGPVDVVFDLTRLEKGEFTFDRGEAPPGGAPVVNVEDVLDGVAMKLEMWEDLAAAIPSTESIARLAPAISASHIDLSAGQWRLVSAVARAANVQQVIDDLDMDGTQCLIGLKGLVEMGVVEIGPAPAAAIPVRTRVPAAADAAAIPAAAPAQPSDDAGGEMEPSVPIGPLRAQDARWLEEEPVDRGLVLRFLSSVRG